MDPLILPVRNVDSLYTVDEHMQLAYGGNKLDFLMLYMSTNLLQWPLKMQVEAIDSSANASILLVDQVAEALVGISCHDLRLNFNE
ncbi:hypothetical protein CASFOL_000411 [Castilleja foliolosa]|uniref:Uncharacterized protein n=1 Tax=Castilleja foliolosa TaxID=1961234 RepID=A0ABD3EPA3_9LAMI